MWRAALRKTPSGGLKRGVRERARVPGRPPFGAGGALWRGARDLANECRLRARRAPPLLRPLPQLGRPGAHPPGLRAPALRLTPHLRKFAAGGLLRLQTPRLPGFLRCDFSKLRENLDTYILGILRFSKKYIFHHLFKREHSELEVAEV